MTGRVTQEFVEAVVGSMPGAARPTQQFVEAIYTPASGISGDMAVSEAADTAAFAGAVEWRAAMAATEGQDAAALSGTVAWVATMAASEAPDVVAMTATVAGDVPVVQPGTRVTTRRPGRSITTRAYPGVTSRRPNRRR
jgi:hypothetical protein